MNHNVKEHLSAERMQAFLDGELSHREIAGVERHLHACVRCSTEVDGWRLLFTELGDLDSARPHEGFHDRVMAAVSIQEPAPIGVRLRDRVAALLPGNRHVGVDAVEEMLEGFLPARQVARVEAHLHACASCASEADALRVVFRKLDGLERMAPAENFADRVMAHVRLTPAPKAVPAWKKALSVGRRFVPQTRQAWAALSGVAVTPAVTMGLVLYAVFSRASVTPGALASFAWWQVSDAAALLWSSASSFAVESLQASGMATLFEALAAAPLLIGAGLAVYTVACGLALRVLYKNLFKNHPMDGRYAHVSPS